MGAPSIPKSHKAAIFKEAGKPLVIEDVETQEPKAGEILVKVLACGVCRSDEITQHAAWGNPLPMIPGHEIVGDVVAVGSGDKQWKVGDRVGGGWHGGHDNQEYCILRTEAVVRVPHDADPAKTAPLLCAGVTVFNSVRQLNVTPGSLVAVQGLGGLGHLALQYLNKMGFKVVALSSSASKEKFAKELGAHEYIDTSKEDAGAALTKLGGAALVVVTAPNPDIVGPLINGLGPRGKLLILAPSPEITVPFGPMIANGLSLHGWPSGHALDSEDAVNFAQVHDVNCLIETFPLSKAQEAYEHMQSGKVRFRSVVVMD
ncbi:hypothetical protein MMC09_004130 [Bachmanniomyces sp. S44760]|nr:hypothetical protein [Bachmanniomyces sp. S44760]